MNYQVKKRCYLIKIGLLLLTALCARVHAGHTDWHEKLSDKLSELNQPTVAFATILHSIDTSSWYDWLTSMNKRNARRMGNALMAQLWKMVWLGLVGVYSRDKIFFRYALGSKLTIDILTQWVRNTKIATMLSHWPIGLALGHGYVLLNQKNLSWGKLYITFLITFSLYYVAQKCYQPLREKIIGDQYQTSNVRYLFDVALGVACTFGPRACFRLSKSSLAWFCKVFPFVILWLEYVRL